MGQVVVPPFGRGIEQMAPYKLEINGARPYFAELPYYVWGQVNYNSEGDCENPLDRRWTWMEITHRDTDAHLTILSKDDEWTIAGPDPTAARVTRFLQDRCAAKVLGESPAEHLGDWNHEEAAARAARVAENFENDRLRPFAAGHLFWGSWKWIGWFGTEFTWVGRWIMDSVVRRDTRAVEFCVDWLREGTVHEHQSAALRYALSELTGLLHSSDQAWLDWYDSVGSAAFPEPDLEDWYSDMKAIHGE